MDSEINHKINTENVEASQQATDEVSQKKTEVNSEVMKEDGMSEELKSLTEKLETTRNALNSMQIGSSKYFRQEEACETIF